MEAPQRSIDRRTALKGAAMAGAASMALAAGGASRAHADEPSDAMGENGWKSWEVKPDPVSDADIVEEIDCDICVVGAGIAGVFAAQSAAEEGGRVVVLEKTGQPQGRGIGIGAFGTAFQKENPKVATALDATEAERIYYEFSHSNVNRLLFRHWAQHSGEAMDHLTDYLLEKHNMPCRLDPTALEDAWDAEEYYRELPTSVTYGDGGWFDEDGNWLVTGIVLKVAQWAQDLGADFRFNTPAEQLVQDETGRVVGVVAAGESGYVKVNAGRGVIIATGDISGSPEMLKAWAPLAARVETSVYNPAGANTGDGIRMSIWAGAGMQHGPAAPMIHPMGPGGPLAQDGNRLGFLCVNRNAQRFTVEVNNTPGMANALYNQPGGVGYTLFDANYRDHILQMRPDNTDIQGFAIVDDETQGKIDAAVEANDGLCFKADTLDDLAAQMGVPADALTQTVARWNELVANGKDEDMDLPSNLLTPLDTPPYYASRMPQAILVVIYGLNCDEHSRVCGEDDEPIEGLYAIGNAQGNFFALDYPLICPGISHGRCVTFGYTLPKAMLKGELI